MTDPIHSDQTPGDDSLAAPAGETSPPQSPVVEGAPPSPDQVKLALRKVKDPELNLNIVDLGLVYEIRVEDSVVEVDMTLTSPGCPAGPQITGDVERAIRALPGVTGVNLQIVWQPFWTPDLIEPRVRAYMGL
jgi:metal-sulfur cluster biosynthetic enzyme